MPVADCHIFFEKKIPSTMLKIPIAKKIPVRAPWTKAVFLGVIVNRLISFCFMCLIKWWAGRDSNP